MSRSIGQPGLRPGDEVVVDVVAIAHGGHCVARHEGRVLFVRHGIPGERVRARITEGGPGDRFLRADAVEVLTSSPDRVAAPCPYAGPGRCGGCDFQHVALHRQRELKAVVLHEQLVRLAGLDLEVPVEPLPLPGEDADAGLGWRTRIEYAVSPDGTPGLRPHRSHDVLPIARCLLATPPVAGAGALDRTWPGERAVDVVASSTGEVIAVPVPSGSGSAPMLTERVAAGSWAASFAVPARGFWQVHPGAAATFVGTVLDQLAPRAGETAVDLYAGAGLFARRSPTRSVPRGPSSPSSPTRAAVAAAVENLATRPWAEVLPGPGRRRVRRAPASSARAGRAALDAATDPAPVPGAACARRPRRPRPAPDRGRSPGRHGRRGAAPPGGRLRRL